MLFAYQRAQYQQRGRLAALKARAASASVIEATQATRIFAADKRIFRCFIIPPSTPRAIAYIHTFRRCAILPMRESAIGRFSCAAISDYLSYTPESSLFSLYYRVILYIGFVYRRIYSSLLMPPPTRRPSPERCRNKQCAATYYEYASLIFYRLNILLVI